MRRFLALWVAGAAAIAAGCGGEVPAVTDCRASGPVTPICGFRNPEDLAPLPGGEWLIVSQFPEDAEERPEGGSLVAFRPRDGTRRVLDPAAAATLPDRTPAGAPACPGPPEAGRFGPHGIDIARDASGATELLVVNHGGREAIELYDVGLGPDGPSLGWRGCIPLPEDVMANDVVRLPDGAVAATHFLPREIGLGTVLRLLLRRPTGRVLVWRSGNDWEPVPASEASAPNGIEAAPDGRTLFVAAWGGEKVVRLGRDGSDRREVPLSFHPDNLTWMSDGRLLVAGQRASVFEARACAKVRKGTCALPFAVASVDPETLEVEELFVHDPPTLGGAASVALEHDGAVWIGTFHGDRLLRVDCL